MPPLPRSRDRRGVQVGFDRVGFWIDTSGVGAAGDGLSLLEEGIQQLLRQRIVVGSALPYAYGINFGHHRSGRLARAAGGTYALQGAIGAVYPRITPALVAAIPVGAMAVRIQLLRLARRIAEEAYRREAWLTGTLARSYLESVEEAGAMLPVSGEMLGNLFE